MSIHALVIESQGLRILVDTCVGNDKERTTKAWSMRSGPFLRDLAAAFGAENLPTLPKRAWT